MNSPGDAASELADSRPTTDVAQPTLRPHTAGTLAALTFLYIVVVVGRIGDIVPALSALPLAKIVAGIAIVIALRNREALAQTAVWSRAPARLTITLMLLATVSMLFSVLHAGTLGVITGTVLSVSIGLVLMIKAARNWAATRLLLFGCVVSAIVLATAAVITSYAGRAGDTRSLDPNDFAFVLGGLLPIVITFAVVSSGVKRLSYFGVAIWVILMILLTQSRGGLLALVVEVLVLISVVPTRRRGQLLFGRRSAAFAARALVLVILSTLTWQTLPQTTRSRLATITSLSSDYNTNLRGDGRFAIWMQTLPLSLHRPWGYGAGTFDTANGLFAGGRYRAPHNMFLQALIELGFPGLLLLIATIVSSVRYVARAFGNRAELSDHEAVERRAFAGGILASLLGLCVSGFFLSELYSEAFWALIALTCVVGRSPEAKTGLPDTISTEP